MPVRKRKREPQLRSIETREKILDGALECLLQRGYAGTTTAALYEVSGVSRGGQQHHFPTREKLIVTAVEHLTTRTLETIRRGVAEIDSASDPVLALLQLLWKATSERWFAAGYELWVAARTDPTLRAVFLPAKDRAGAEIFSLCMDVLPKEVTGHPEFAIRLRTSVNLLHGLALTRFIESNEKDVQFTLELCRDIILAKIPPAPVLRSPEVDNRRVRELEDENAGLKALLAEQMLENARLRRDASK
jgi:AcrR family transcriptional regulator